MPNHVEIATQAERDRGRLDKPVRKRNDEKLRVFYDEPLPANIDIDPMTGCPPWKRVRAGEYRSSTALSTAISMRLRPRSGY